MTILSACQEAAIELLGYGSMPSSLFSSTDEFAVELRTLANKTATALAKAHDWRKLTVLNTTDGDDDATSFALPSDYDRMPLKAQVWSSARTTPLERVEELDHWLHMQLTETWASGGCWILLGGTLQIAPAMSVDESAKFYYLSNLLWTPNGGSTATKTVATADADTCALPERLITLGVIWRWKKMKGKEYAEDLKDAEIAFGEETGREKGSRILHVGRKRISDDANLSYGGSVGPGSTGLEIE
jgi:hypothetical protein